MRVQGGDVRFAYGLGCTPKGTYIANQQPVECPFVLPREPDVDVVVPMTLSVSTTIYEAAYHFQNMIRMAKTPTTM